MKKRSISSAREVALWVLQDVWSEKAYANLSLSKWLGQARLQSADRRLATELAYGTVKAHGTLNWILSHYLKRSLSKTDPLVANILRLGVYQIVYLDRIPDSAAVNEAVKLAKQYAHPGAAGFVNAILRSYIREPQRILWPDPLKNPARSIALQEWHPEWLVERWLNQIGLEETRALCQINNQHPPLVFRTNTLKIQRDLLVERMRLAGMSCEMSTRVPEAIICQPGGEDPLQFLREGLCQAQDESSMLVAHVVNPQPGNVIIDACAAPGGKTTHIAALMQNSGKILALDIHDHKLQLIHDNATRLGIHCIKTWQMDAQKMHERFFELADCVLVDAPCSGLGVLRRRPDLRWRLDQTEGDLPELQKAILSSAAKCVKPGGCLVYSTCTLSEIENEKNIEWFLQHYPEFHLDRTGDYLPLPQPQSMVTLWPQRDEMDGFFIARMVRGRKD